MGSGSTTHDHGRGGVAVEETISDVRRVFALDRSRRQTARRESRTRNARDVVSGFVDRGA
jgi:hypothetical protein